MVKLLRGPLKLLSGPRRATRSLKDSINNICINLESHVSVAQYLGSEYLLTASLTLLGGESCLPTGVSGLAVQVPRR